MHRRKESRGENRGFPDRFHHGLSFVSPGSDDPSRRKQPTGLRAENRDMSKRKEPGIMGSRQTNIPCCTCSNPRIWNRTEGNQLSRPARSSGCIPSARTFPRSRCRIAGHRVRVIPGAASPAQRLRPRRWQSLPFRP